MAYQVFKPELAPVDISIQFNQRWRAYSGSQYLICWASQADANDDWVITPELNGEEQVISFYIKSVSIAYEERFRVLVSKSSNDQSDFTRFDNTESYYKPNGEWRRFGIRVPKGT